MKRTLILIFFGLVLGSSASYIYRQQQPPALSNESFETLDVASETPEPVLAPEQKYPYVIAPGSSLTAELRKLDVGHQDIHEIVKAAKSIRDLGRLSAGTRFQIGFAPNDAEMLSNLSIRITSSESLSITKSETGEWTAQKVMKEIETRVTTFRGLVKSSLWESAVEAQMNPTLIADLAEIFAWQVDFSREVRIGDRWRLSVEEEYVDGAKIGWGSILSAEYTNADQTFTAVLFRKDKEDLGYFAPDGSSLKRVFLKSPIQYGRISSRFQKRRLHPVLKTARPHNGVDYAAPTGTPIRAVGDGVVQMIGRNGGAGNMIKLSHNATYATAYKHMSRFAKGLKKGSRVQQGQTIGYVGTTGLSTGPHLHFEFYVNGGYVDPLGRRFPASAPVPVDQLSEFTTVKQTYLAHLPPWDEETSGR